MKPFNLLRTACVLTALGLLSACSFAPLPFDTNLLEDQGVSGSFNFATPSGEVSLLPFIGASSTGAIGPFSSPVAATLDVVSLADLLGLSITIPPSQQGFLLDFSEEPLPANLTQATVSYELSVSGEGPVSAELGLQVYLAPVASDNLLQADYALGDVQRISIAEGDTSVGASVELSGVQLDAINAGEMRLAVAVVEGSISFSEAGQASLAYAFDALTLDVGSVSARIDEQVPSPEGDTLDFSDVDVPGPGRIVNLGVDYELVVALPAQLGGSAKVQVYIAPVDEPNPFQEQYAFGQNHDLDLNTSSLRITDRASLEGDQKRVLRDKTLRYGVQVTAAPDVELGQDIQIDYGFEKLELFGGYSLN